MTTGQDQGSTVGSEISVNAQVTRESLGEIHTPVDQGISLFIVGQPLYLFVVPDALDLLRVTLWSCRWTQLSSSPWICNPLTLSSLVDRAPPACGAI